jgi:hypothetical protein
MSCFIGNVPQPSNQLFLSLTHYMRSWAVRRRHGVDSFPNFQTMDGDFGSGLKTKAHRPAFYPEHRDFEHALETVGATNHNRFLTFPG